MEGEYYLTESGSRKSVSSIENNMGEKLRLDTMEYLGDLKQFSDAGWLSGRPEVMPRGNGD